MHPERRIETAHAPFSGSYEPGDVTFLLKPVSLAPTELATKEALVQSGRRHYSEMIGAEEAPTPAYLDLYEAALARNAGRLAADIASLAAHLAARADGREVVLASLVRAGTPIGALLLRALRARGLRAAHYGISIIRDRGIDQVALAWIAERHDPRDVLFVDGWTGKGRSSASCAGVCGTGLSASRPCWPSSPTPRARPTSPFPRRII